MKKKLDKALSTAVQHYTVPTLEGGWDALQDRLDRHDHSARRRKILFFISIALIMLGTSAAFLSRESASESGKSFTNIPELNLTSGSAQPLMSNLTPKPHHLTDVKFSNEYNEFLQSNRKPAKSNPSNDNSISKSIDHKLRNTIRIKAETLTPKTYAFPIVRAIPEDNKNYVGEVKKSELRHIVMGPPLIPRLAFSLRVMPGMVLRDLKVSDAGDIHKNYKGIRKGQEGNRVGFSTGFNFTLPLAPKFSIESGLSQTTIGERIDYDFKNNEVPVFDSSSNSIVGYLTVVDTVGVKRSRTNSYNYINIPVSVLYNFRVSRNLSVVAGVQGMLMYLNGVSAERISFVEMMPEKVSVADMRRFNGSFGLVGGIRRDLGKHVQLQLTAGFSKMAGNIYRTDKISARPGFAGIGFSMNYKIN